MSSTFISNVGYILVSLTFIFCLISTVSFLLYHRDRNEALLTLARRSFYATTATAGIVMAMIILLIQSHHFEFNYVYSYSSTALNKFYLFATLWAGQEGTFMMWLFFGCLYGLVLIRTVARKMPLALFFLGLVHLTLLVILLKKNPFMLIWHTFEQVPVGFTPQEGAGLNPLLQNFWMVIHPPTLFVGYSSTVVAFVLAMTALVTRDKHEWIKAARPWVIFNVLVLGTGIIMGGYWAYVTLGWGGYWAWDPVENASLVPWLFSVALLHGIMIQEKRNSLIRSNLFFAGGSFLAMLWGSYLTRSGVLSDFSVHSFAPSGLAFYLIMFQAIFTVLFFVSFGRYTKALKREGYQDATFGSGFFNRETIMLMGMLMFTVSALMVLFGTSAPLYTRMFGDPASVSPDFYNTMILPIAFFVLISMGLAPLLAWKTSEMRNVKTLIWAGGIAAMATIAAVAIGLDHPGSIIIFFLASFAIAINLWVTWLLIRANYGKAGGYLVHAGWAFIAIGIVTSSIYDTSEKIMLPRDTPLQTSLGYELEFVGFREMPDGKDEVRVMVRKANLAYEANPRFYYSDYSKAYMITPDVNVEFVQDVYIAPISFTPAEMGAENTVLLGKQESQTVGDLTITFNKFIAAMDAQKQVVTADITVKTSAGGYATEHNLLPVLTASGGQMNSDPVQIPDTQYRVSISRVNASTGQVELTIAAPGAAGITARDMMAVEVTIKPFISILWFGSILFIIGGMLTLLGRRRQRGSAATA